MIELAVGDQQFESAVRKPSQGLKNPVIASILVNAAGRSRHGFRQKWARVPTAQSAVVGGVRQG